KVPGVSTDAGASSTTSRSRSVALKETVLSDARSNTLDKMGMVVRRSTTLVTWPRARSSSPRSITSRMADPRILVVSKSASQKCRGAVDTATVVEAGTHAAGEYCLVRKRLGWTATLI